MKRLIDWWNMQHKAILLVQLVVEIPKKLSAEQEQLLRDYAKTEEVDVNSESKSFFEKIKKHFNNK